MRRTKIPAPSLDQMPARRDDGRGKIDVELEVVTPIYGGSVVPREVDLVDVIRAPSIRGHLRFWWRALYAHTLASDELYRKESELWGGATRKGEGFENIGRSRVELTVTVQTRSPTLEGPPQDPAQAYALFPARSQTNGTPAAKFRERGTRFKLTLQFPKVHEEEVRATVKAWILFGGYGGRTRRGLGSLTVTNELNVWLPSRGHEALTSLTNPKGLQSASTAKQQTPSLIGAQLFETFDVPSSTQAWSKAVGWLRDFRQGSNSEDGARQPPRNEDPNRPSISNWPEADKVRHFSKPGRFPWAHKPRHNAAPAWPRAGFGLPIIGQFQGKNRQRKPWAQATPPSCEPDEFRIGWQQGNQIRERLASPVILKPLALANGQFRPIALWLNRANPEGEVILQRSNGDPVHGTGVPFGQFLAPDDKVLFAALKDKRSLQEAFFAWLEAHAKVQQSSNSGKKSKKYKRDKR